MFNNRGSTLIESLLAFEIFISIFIIFISLMTTVFSQEVQIQQHYQNILKKEGEISFSEDFTENVQMALH